MIQSPEKIIFRGREYASLDEMPEADRQVFQKLDSQFVDRDGNGVPDCFENGGKPAFELEGVENPAYHSREEIEELTTKAFLPKTTFPEPLKLRNRQSPIAEHFITRWTRRFMRLAKWIFCITVLITCAYVALTFWEGV